MEHIKQEYPSYGAGDMRYPAVEILQENGSRITDFVYQTHRIYDGKPALAGLPATYTEDSKEAQTLEIELKDELIHTTLILYYTIFEELPAITRSAKVIYHGTEKIVLETCNELQCGSAGSRLSNDRADGSLGKRACGD